MVSDEEGLKEAVIRIMADLYEISVELGIQMDQIFTLVESQRVNKKQAERMKDYSLELGRFLENGFVVLRGNTEVMLEQLAKYIRRAEDVWNNAVSMYEAMLFNGLFPLHSVY